MAAKYNKLLKLYGTCHRGINSGSILCENDIKQLCKSKAEEVAAKYNKLFKLYGTCHRGINSGSILCEKDIKQFVRAKQKKWQQSTSFSSCTVHARGINS